MRKGCVATRALFSMADRCPGSTGRFMPRKAISKGTHIRGGECRGGRPKTTGPSPSWAVTQNDPH